MKLRQFGIVAFAVCSLIAGSSGYCNWSPLGEIVLYVDDDAALGGDGLTWETANRFLQDALNFAAQPENDVYEIRVAQGIYQPDRDEGNPTGDGDRKGTFQLINGVSLLGGYAGIGAYDPDERDIEQFETILSGDLLSDDEADFKNKDENSFHVVTGSFIDNSAVLDGFTITAGNANDSWPDNVGAGIYISLQEQDKPLAGPQVSNCIFSLNLANKGGGIWIGHNTNPQISNCKFIANWATSGGGGIYNRADDAKITGCQFIGNRTIFIGGGMFNSSDAITDNCEFLENSAGWGGGMMSFYAIEPVIINCSFFNNVANVEGGGMYIKTLPISNLTIANCLFSHNSASYGGGVYYLGGGGSASLTNVTITYNIAGTDGGIRFSGNLHVSNSVIWGNKNGQISDFYDPDYGETVTYNCVEGGYKGLGNIDANPLFVDPENNDYRLLPGSPCNDSGFNNAVSRDFADLDSDEDFTEFIPFDFDGNPRFVDDPASKNVGCGVMALVDMGAFEFQDGKATQPLPGDFDGDGAITVADLIQLLSEWGTCDSCCLADVDINGSASTSDLLLFLSYWNSR